MLRYGEICSIRTLMIVGDPATMHIRPFEIADQAAVIELWQLCELTRPWNDAGLDIQRKLAVNREWFLVGELRGQIVSSAMFGYEGHRGWVNYLAVHPEHQGQGYARAMMARGEQLLLSAGCPKINLQVRSSNSQALAFYARLGYGIDEVVSLGKRLIQDG